MYEYLLWLSIFVISPLMIVWLIKFQDLKKYGVVLILTLIGAFIFSVPWDIIAVRERVWYFKEPQILGILLLGLPIEEYLFIISVTLWGSTLTILLWESLGKK